MELLSRNITQHKFAGEQSDVLASFSELMQQDSSLYWPRKPQRKQVESAAYIYMAGGKQQNMSGNAEQGLHRTSKDKPCFGHLVERAMIYFSFPPHAPTMLLMSRKLRDLTQLELAREEIHVRPHSGEGTWLKITALNAGQQENLYLN